MSVVLLVTLTAVFINRSILCIAYCQSSLSPGRGGGGGIGRPTVSSIAPGSLPLFRLPPSHSLLLQIPAARQMYSTSPLILQAQLLLYLLGSLAGWASLLATLRQRPHIPTTNPCLCLWCGQVYQSLGALSGLAQRASLLSLGDALLQTDSHNFQY